MSYSHARRVPAAVALACVGALALASCGSTQDAATPVSTSPTDSLSPMTPPADTLSPMTPPASTGSATESGGLVGQSPSAHSNAFTMAGKSGVDSVGFSFGGNYFISPGQESTWGGVTGCQPGPACDITVIAGRHDDPATSAWFNANASAYGCDYGPNCSPKGMNFALTGTITINGADYPFTLGQFGDGWFSNYWIYGGPGWSPASGPNGATTPDGKYSVNCCSPVTVKAT